MAVSAEELFKQAEFILVSGGHSPEANRHKIDYIRTHIGELDTAAIHELARLHHAGNPRDPDVRDFAIQELERRVPRLEERDLILLANLYVGLDKNERMKASRDDYENACDVLEDNLAKLSARGLCFLATLYNNGGEPRSAVALLGPLLKPGASLATIGTAHNIFANALLFGKWYRQAADHLQQAISSPSIAWTDKDMAFAADSYGKALRLDRRPDAAVRFLEPHMRPGEAWFANPFIRLTYAWALFEAGRKGDAAGHLEDLLRTPDIPRGVRRQGEKLLGWIPAPAATPPNRPQLDRRPPSRRRRDGGAGPDPD